MYAPYVKASYLGIGDENGDGRDDVFFSNPGAFSFMHTVYAWRMDGTTFEIAARPSTEGSSQRVLDADGDAVWDVLEPYGSAGARLHIARPAPGAPSVGVLRALPASPWKLIEPLL